MARTLRFEAVYPFPPEQVWLALTDPVALADWLMPNDFKPELGHRFQFRAKPAPGFDGIVHCQVSVLDPPKTLAFTWEGGGIDTVVTFGLSAAGAGTRVVMQQSGFTGVRGMFVSTMLKGGWKGMIETKLPDAASRVTNGRYQRRAL